MTDINTMPVRELIVELRKQASELGVEHLATTLFTATMVTRIEQEADRADAAVALLKEGVECCNDLMTKTDIYLGVNEAIDRAVTFKKKVAEL